MMRRPLPPVLLACSLLGCSPSAAVAAATSTPPERRRRRAGKQLVGAFGCGGCHQIAGVSGRDGQVGPSLAASARRVHRRLAAEHAGELSRWIGDPKRIDPGTLMPDLGVSRTQAQAIADYLYRH